MEMPKKTPEEIIQDIEISKRAKEILKKDLFKTFGEVARRGEKIRRNIDINKVCKYGIRIIDEYMGGIGDSELVVIGADSGIGKSEIAYNIAFTNALIGKKVCLFALEGDVNEIGYRFMQRRVNERLKTRFVKSIEYRFNMREDINYIIDEEMETMRQEISENITIYDDYELPDLHALTELIELVKDDVDMIVIDHLHYLQYIGDNESRGIGEVMRGLKRITDKMHKPIVLISHLKRRKTDEDPTGQDFYGSSNIEKEATTTLFVCKGKDEGKFDKAGNPTRKKETKFIIGKSRMGGPRGKFLVKYDTIEKRYCDDEKDDQTLDPECMDISSHSVANLSRKYL